MSEVWNNFFNYIVANLPFYSRQHQHTISSREILNFYYTIFFAQFQQLELNEMIYKAVGAMQYILLYHRVRPFTLPILNRTIFSSF